MSIRKIKTNEISSVVDFINENYNTGYGSYVIIDDEFCKNVLNSGFILINEDNGNIMSCLFIIYINKTITIATHLCVEEDSREQGYASEIIEYVRKMGITSNYRVLYKETPQAMKLNIWYRPLNLQLCQENGYYYQDSINNRLLYKVKQPLNVDIRSCNYEDYKKFVNDDINFDKISKIVKFYSVYKNKDLIGIFGYYPVTIYIQRKDRTIKFASVSIIKSNNDENMKWILKSLYYIAFKNKCIFCYIYQLDDVNIFGLKETHALKVDNPAYLESENINDFNYILL
jgi:N-acetylglutamate synthase-like GNAT family acetyltransferase